MRRLVLTALTLLAACGEGPPPDPGKAESYAVRVDVIPANGAAEQRIPLPPEALVQLRDANLADLRLFDANGRALPLALAPSLIPAEQAGSEVPVYPVIGSTAPGNAGVALIIGPDNIARVSGIPAGPGYELPVAALIDTRKVIDPTVAVVLDVDLPLQRPVTMTLEASADLKTWEPLGEKVMFRTNAAGAQLDAGRILLPAASLKDRYLRASWGDIGDVSVRGARVVTSGWSRPARTAVATSGARLVNPRELRFDMPFAGPLAAVRIEPSDGEGVLPVELAARDNPEAPWQPIAAATLRKPGSAGNVLELGGGARREYRVTADERTPGFAAPPKVELLFDKVWLVTQFNGKPPYTLAAGLAGAPSTLLSAKDIAPDNAQLGSATVKTQRLAALDVTPGEKSEGIASRQTLLWAVLLAGVAILGFAVIRLMRGSRSGDPE